MNAARFGRWSPSDTDIASQRSSVRILVVEDERKLAASLGEGLRDAHYTVDVATDGHEALDYVRTSTYDALILDIQLPGVDGLDVCRWVRARGDATPILMLTARDTLADKVAGLDRGADDYLTKPFALDELLARLRALLRRNSQQKDGLLRVGDLTLDPAARAVERMTRPIELTKREYCILETLMRRPGWVVTRDAIIESVWGFEFPDSSNLIEVYIARLRRKLGEPTLIQTVRGTGYRIQDPAA
jgi:DNA-binding response OmpR family regulator